MTRLDPSLWNLGVPAALLSACTSMLACGPIVAVGETDSGPSTATDTSVSDSDSDSDSVTSPTTTPSTTTPSTTTPTGCVVDEDCPPNYRCEDGTCYYSGCDDYCCYDDCCSPECGWYNECYSAYDCPVGEACQYYQCYALTAEAVCESVPFGIGFEIPMPSGVYTLAFIETDGNAERELLIGGSGLTLARIDGTTTVIDPNPFVLDIEVGDVDGDGDQDIVIADGNSLRPQVYFAEAGGWDIQEIEATEAAEMVALADLDGDGFSEVVTASGSNNSYAYRYNGTPGSWETYYAWGSAYLVTSGSLDDDPFGDLLYSGYGNYALVGGFGFGVVGLYNGGVGQSFQRGVIGNFDGQGVGDVIATQAVNGGTVVTMWPGSVADGNGWWMSWWPTSAEVTTVGDLNSDGYADVVGGSGAGLTIGWGGPEPDGIVCTSSTATPYGAYMVAVGDMSGDGRPDVALSDGLTAYVMLRTD